MDTTLRIPPTHTATPPGRHRAAILACALLSLALCQAAKAAPGDLDTSFDADGLVLTHFGRIDDDSVGGRNDFANAVAVAPDGKLVVAGSTQANGGLNLDFALARYNPDGTPDTSFGTGGRVLTDIPHAFDFNSDDDALALVVQPDGKPVVAGVSGIVFLGDFVLARYNPDGSLDANFDNDGFVFTNFDSESFHTLSSGASAMVLQPDGKLVAAGSTIILPTFIPDGGRCESCGPRFALARYNPEGSLDTSFGSGGFVLTDFEEGPFGAGIDHVAALVLQSDGKLVAAGTSRVTQSWRATTPMEALMRPSVPVGA